MADLLNSIQGFLAVFVLSLIPVTESKLAITLGIAVYHLPLWAAVLAGTLSTIVVSLVLIPTLGWITGMLRKIHPKINELIDRVFAATYHKHTPSFERWGTFALFLFVAIPLPFTGVWSGSLLAHLFGIRYKHAVLALALGTFVASLIVGLATVGVSALSTL